jgi:hypothetical protein
VKQYQDLQHQGQLEAQQGEVLTGPQEEEEEGHQLELPLAPQLLEQGKQLLDQAKGLTIALNQQAVLKGHLGEGRHWLGLKLQVKD